MDATIKASRWDDDSFGGLDDAGKVLWIYLDTGPLKNNIGYSEVSKRALLHHTGKDMEGLVCFLKGLPSRYHFDLCEGRARVLVLPFVAEQWQPGMLGSKSKLFQNLRNCFLSLPEPFAIAFKAAYPTLVSLYQASSELEGVSKSLARDQSRAEQSRAEQRGEEGSGGKGDERDPPHLPTWEEFAAEFIADGIPAEWLRTKFDWLNDNAGWLTRFGDLKPWRKFIRRWWTEARSTWRSGLAGKKNGATISVAQQAFELDRDIRQLEAEMEDLYAMNEPVPEPLRARLRELQKKRAAIGASGAEGKEP